MKRERPALPLYARDFVFDERVRMMSLAARGAYITLLCYEWLEGSIPKDEAACARLCDAKPEDFRPVWKEVRKRFQVSEFSRRRLVNLRLELVRKSLEKFLDVQRGNGEKAAKVRWRSKQVNKIDEVGYNSGIAPALGTLYPTDTLQLQLQNKPPTPFDFEGHFEEVWKTYPAKGQTKRPDAQRWYVEKLMASPDPAALHGLIMASIPEKWAKSQLWADGFVNSLSEFLRLERWAENPEPTASVAEVDYPAPENWSDHAAD